MSISSVKFAMLKGPVSGLFLLIFTFSVHSQRYLADFDSSFFIKDTLRPFIKRFENLRISGYMQPQFQVAEADGANSFEGGDFSQFSSSRFMLRRARIRIDYLIAKGKFPRALFTFQIDATERGVVLKDMFIRLFETKKNVLSMTTGFVCQTLWI